MANGTLEYRDGSVTLKGHLAEAGGREPRPGVVLFPEAFGIGEHVIERARRLAAIGYVALAADPYGDGKQASDLPSASAPPTTGTTTPKRSESRPSRMLPSPVQIIVAVYGSAAADRATPNSASTAGRTTITDHIPTLPMAESTSAAKRRAQA